MPFITCFLRRFYSHWSSSKETEWEREIQTRKNTLPIPISHVIDRRLRRHYLARGGRPCRLSHTTRRDHAWSGRSKEPSRSWLSRPRNKRRTCAVTGRNPTGTVVPRPWGVFRAASSRPEWLKLKRITAFGRMVRFGLGQKSEFDDVYVVVNSVHRSIFHTKRLYVHLSLESIGRDVLLINAIFLKSFDWNLSKVAHGDLF